MFNALLKEFELKNNNISKLIIPTNFEKKMTPLLFNSKEDKKQHVKEDYFSVPYKNKLLWFLYIVNNGMGSYEQVTSNYYSVEQETKFIYIDVLRNNKKIMKYKKWKIKEIEHDITFSNCFSLTTLECLSYLSGINLYYIDNNKIYTSIDNTFHKNMIIHKINNEYKLELIYDDNILHKKTLEYRNKLWNIENISKPLKNIASYKLQHLIDIANKLKINIMNTPTKKKTKKVLYNEIRDLI
mgnify:CR=1 FL=1